MGIRAVTVAVLISLCLSQGYSQETQHQTIIATLEKGLADSDRGVRFAAAQALGKSGDLSVLPALIKTLSDDEWCVRAQAAHSIAAFGADSVPVFANALQSPDDRVRLLATNSLARMGAPGRGALRAALDDGNERVRYLAARAIADESVVPVLRELLGATDGVIGIEAARILTDLGHGSDAVSTLLDGMRSYRGMPKTEVAAILKRNDALGAEAVPTLIEIRSAATKDESRLRRAIEEILVQIGQPAEEAILRMIEQEDDEPKWRGLVWVLERIRAGSQPTEKEEPPYPVPTDEELFLEPSDRRRAAHRLALEPENRERLFDLLETKPTAEFVFDALLGLEEGIPVTDAQALALLESPGPAARRLGIRALHDMGKPEAIRQLQDDPDETVRACAAWALAPAKPEPPRPTPALPPVDVLVTRLSDPDLAVSLFAADALPRHGAAAAKPLAQAMATGHYGVLHYAEWIFMQLGPQGAPAVEALIPLASHEDVNVREVAIRSLGEIGPDAASAIPALMTALGDIRISVRGRAAVALGRIGEAAAPALLRAAMDPDARVRASAIYALGWILGDRNGIRQEATDLRLPVAEPGPAAETGFVPTDTQLARARSLADSKSQKESREPLADLPKEELVAVLRAGLRLSDLRTAVVCAAALDMSHLDAWEAERCVELLLPEVFGPNPPTSFGDIYEYLGSSEVAATLGYLAISDISDYDRKSNVLGACHRIVRWDLLPELYRIESSRDAWVVDSDYDVWMPRYWSDRYREMEGPLRGLLERESLDTHLVNSWLNDSVPTPADAELLLKWGWKLRGEDDDDGSLAVMLRAMGHLQDRETESFLLTFFAEARTAGHFARSALARRGDPDALRRLREDAETDWLPLSLLMEVRPEIGIDIFARQLLEGDCLAPCWELSDSFVNVRYHGVRWPDDLFDGIEEQALQANLGPKRLARIALMVPGCRTRRMAGAILSKLPGEAEQFMVYVDDSGWEESRELAWPERSELISILHAADPAGVKALLRTWARSENGELRWFALDMLQAIGDPESASLLLESLPDRTARSPEPEYIFRDLGRSGSPAVERLLIERIKNPDTHEALRRDCMRELAILYGLPGPDAWPYLDPEEDPTRMAALAEQIIARRPLVGVVEFMRGQVPEKIDLPVLGSLAGSAVAREFLTELAGRRGSCSYPEVLGQLARLGDEKARRELWSGIRAGRYRWICYENEYNALTLGWDPATYPALLAETETNCCRGGHVARMFEELMGRDALDYRPHAQDESPIRNAREWLRLYGGRWTRTPFGDDMFRAGPWTSVPK